MYISLGDSGRLASKLTRKRIWNAYRIYTSYLRARRLGEPDIRGLPISLSVEPTTACNLRCPECPSGLRSFTRPTGKLSASLFEQVMDELDETLLYLILYFQGEPYLHPGFLELVAEAHRRGIYTATSTNAHFLSAANATATVKSGLDRLIISIDGITQETYSAYRREGNLDQVLAGTKEILAARKALRSGTPQVVWQFLVVAPNEHEIPGIRRLAAEMGLDKLALKTAQIYDYASGSPLIPQQEQFSRYRKMADGRYAPRKTATAECWKMWHSAVLTWDGRVVPCCFDKDAQYEMGQLGSQSFAEIWHSEKYRDFRKQLLKGRSEIEMCKNCSEGGKVWA